MISTEGWLLVGLLALITLLLILATPWPRCGPFVHRGRHRR